MKIDMHVHVAGNGRRLDRIDDDVFFDPADNQHWFTRILYHLLEENLQRARADRNADGTVSTDEYFELLYRLFCDAREIDGMTLLAMDGVYSTKTGALLKKETDILVGNRFLARRVAALNARLAAEADARVRAKRFFFAASVSPNRKDWERELAYVLEESEAVAIKLIPSVMHLELGDKRHHAYYDALAAHRMPILCHVGPEYAFPEGIRKRALDTFTCLDGPLARSVTVIAAHCATPVFPLIDKNETRAFAAFMHAANAGGATRLYADTSALSMTTRIHLIPSILELFPPEWLLHGTDFPLPVDGWAHLPLLTRGMTPKEYLAIQRTQNPFDRDVRIKRAAGFNDRILGNAERVLRMPVAGKPAVDGAAARTRKKRP
jgi:predicted TIM-barrel fold metal-dependent hydrolase